MTGYIIRKKKQKAHSILQVQLGLGPMRTAAISVLLVLLLVERSSAVTAPSSQCAYFNYYYFRNSPLLPSLVPSISSKCLAAYNPDGPKAICIADCRSLYSVLSQCTYGEASAAGYAVATCGGKFNNIDCSTLARNDTNGLTGAVSSACSNYTYCSSSCLAAIAALERYSGCCSANDLNGPKVVCGQQPIAPCSTVLNSGSVTAPTSECAYASYGSYSSHTAEYTECKKGEQSLGSICIAECRPYFALVGRCNSVLSANYSASSLCGKFNNENCSSYSNPVGRNLTTQLRTACSNSTYCPPSCVNAIAAAERYGGCCYAENLNGPKVLCGQQPIAPCSTIVSSGSAAIKFNLLVVMIFMISAAYF